ncbi:FAS1-like dehydratase domain-containing protein [Metabacillus sp. RGM 3146]|uniref:FAS1-like dehydratase domain-containing protein n=1 Tax=Metabacillus sp. RGM 3146 TaxID=3401092 RepID=UPI003B99E1B2
MKTEAQEILFTDKDVLSYVQALGDRNPVYQSAEQALQHGYKHIPLPPLMPVISYQRISVPWELQAPVIHREQQCTLYQVMFSNEKYKAVISLSDQRKHGDYFFVRQTLHLYDLDGHLCFTGVSSLVAGGIHK